MSGKLPIETVLRSLCIADRRNPDWFIHYGFDEIEDVPDPGKNCSCDNCFYGRDRLAMEILRLMENNTTQRP